MVTSSPLQAAASIQTELPLLASQAAIEFDCAIKGREIGFAAAESLGHFIQHDAVDDFITENLVYQALATSEWKPGVTTVADAEAASPILGEALVKSTLQSPEKWPLLRDFCVAFSNKLVKHRQLLRASLPANPNRR